MKNLLITILLFSYGLITAQSGLEGVVLDKETEEPISNAVVELFQEGILIFKEETDKDGQFIFDELVAGTFEMDISHLEYQSTQMIGISVPEGGKIIVKVRLDIGLSLDKVVDAMTRKALQRTDRKLRKYLKGLPGKGFKRLKKKAKKEGRNMGRRKS